MTDAPRFELFSYWRTSATYRVRVACNLKGVPRQERNVDIDGGEHLGAAFPKVNPMGVGPGPAELAQEQSMNTTDFQAFRVDALAAGFDDAVERRWAPGTEVATHTHDFGVEAVVTQGEMWLTSNGQTRHLTPGSTFALPPGAPHDERYGAEGATYWAARRNPR